MLFETVISIIKNSSYQTKKLIRIILKISKQFLLKKNVNNNKKLHFEEKLQKIREILKNSNKR